MQELPEVYQVEVTRACNFKCPMCPTQFFPRENNEQFLQLGLLDKIISQGDLDNSYFVELQMGGEPLLHPHLDEIITMIKSTGVKVGLSTNGSHMMLKMRELLRLDSITVSIDSLTDYNDIRVGLVTPTDVGSLIKNLKELLEKAELEGVAVDLQVIELEGWEKQMDLINEVFEHYQYNLRSIPNGYVHYLEPQVDWPTNTELCINPWMSVSIQCNGHVTSCCVAQGDDIIYGDLKTQTLREVWAGDAVENMRTKMRLGAYPEVCKKCYTRSPALFHQNMLRGKK